MSYHLDQQDFARGGFSIDTYYRFLNRSLEGAAVALGGVALLAIGVANKNAAEVASGVTLAIGGGVYGDYYERRRFTLEQQVVQYASSDEAALEQTAEN